MEGRHPSHENTNICFENVYALAIAYVKVIEFNYEIIIPSSTAPPILLRIFLLVLLLTFEDLFTFGRIRYSQQL